MNEYNYHITIKKTGVGKQTVLTGTLLFVSQEYDKTSTTAFLPATKEHEVHFNPLTILGDLRNRELPYEYRDNRLNFNAIPPCTIPPHSYDYEYGFGTPIYIDNTKQYLAFLSELNTIMQYNTCKTLEDLETIRTLYKIEIDCKISKEEPNIYFELLQRRNRNAERYVYEPLDYTFGKPNNELTQRTYLKENHQFSYRCYTVTGILFAILHFIVIHEYVFRTCSLCQKKYAKIPNNGQGKYCPRISPLSAKPYFENRNGNLCSKFENLSCTESMIKFHEIIRNMKKNKLHYAHTDEAKNHFLTEFDKYNDTVTQSPTINNLITLYNFVKNYVF